MLYDGHVRSDVGFFAFRCKEVILFQAYDLLYESIYRKDPLDGSRLYNIMTYKYNTSGILFYGIFYIGTPVQEEFTLHIGPK